jgi:hypothetical protein
MLDHISIDRALASFGAEPTDWPRPLAAAASDGSLILLCRSGGFSRPGIGVLRYTAQLSAARVSATRRTRVQSHLSNALSTSADVRLIIETSATARTAARIHVRPDLVGKVTDFDGDEYVVDFSRPPPPPRPGRARRA